MEKKRNTFTGSLGFVLAAAGSAVGLGNIWRFPYLAARDGDVTRSGMEGLKILLVPDVSSLPRVFEAMGPAGNVIGCLFFALVLFAATTSSVSILEAIVASFMDQFHLNRKRAVLLLKAIGLV